MYGRVAETTCTPEAGCKHTEYVQHVNNFALWKSSVIEWQNYSLPRLKFEDYKTRELQIISLKRLLEVIYGTLLFTTLPASGNSGTMQ